LNLIEQKKQLRSKLLVLRKNIPNKQFRSDVFCIQFLSDKRFIDAKNILLYYPTQDEVNIIPLIEHCLKYKKNVYLPFIKDIAIGKVSGVSDIKIFGSDYKEPTTKIIEADNIKLDLIILPGLGFDNKGNRIGRGKGWYDRFVESLPTKPILLGVSFVEQLQKNIPQLEHDIKMDQVLVA
jgi:5-formyltetrahydrofolate cyclo-ligase